MTNWLEALAGETRTRLLVMLRRANRTISGLASELGLTDNAIRTHIAALGRDGIVEDVGTQRDTGGKPARVYALTREGEELFPKAYALVLGGLVDQIVRDAGRDRAIALLKSVGAQVASGVVVPADAEARVHAAATTLRELGGEVEVQKTDTGWRVQGFGCPLSAVTAGHPEVCALAKAIVEEITGRPVVECCERGARPRCAFEVAGKP